MGEINVGQFYVYRDEDGNAVAIAMMSKGPNGGRMGIDYARMGVPFGTTTREDINNRAEFMAAAMNTFGNTRSVTAAKDAEITRLREALCKAADQLAKVHDDAFKQAGGYGLMTSDGRDFSCLELNECETVAREARLALSPEEK